MRVDFFFFQAEDGIRDIGVTGVQTCALPILVLGLLPLGSGNDYVKALGVDVDLGRALEVLVGGEVRVVDAGEVNGVRFNNGLGIGFDAEVAVGVARAPARLGGAGRYMWSVGRLLWGFRCYEATLRLDGREAVEARTILVAVALGTTFGARFRLAPEARLDDGLFDVVWSEEVSRTEVLRLVPARSEEHTSELQSCQYLVCRLLL